MQRSDCHILHSCMMSYLSTDENRFKILKSTSYLASIWSKLIYMCVLITFLKVLTSLSSMCYMNLDIPYVKLKDQRSYKCAHQEKYNVKQMVFLWLWALTSNILISNQFIRRIVMSMTKGDMIQWYCSK